VWNPWRRLTLSQAKRLAELERIVYDDLAPTTEITAKRLVRLEAKLRQRARAELERADEAGADPSGDPSTFSVAPQRAESVTDESDRSSTRDALRQRARARGWLPNGKAS
jgi:hypothetical protein